MNLLSSDDELQPLPTTLKVCSVLYIFPLLLQGFRPIALLLTRFVSEFSFDPALNVKLYAC